MPSSCFAPVSVITCLYRCVSTPQIFCCYCFLFGLRHFWKCVLYVFMIVLVYKAISLSYIRFFIMILGHISIIFHLCIYLWICGIFRCLSRYRWTRFIMTDPSSQTKFYVPCAVELVWLSCLITFMFVIGQNRLSLSGTSDLKQKQTNEFASEQQRKQLDISSHWHWTCADQLTV